MRKSILTLVLLSACKQQEAPPAHATSIASCDRFIVRYARCEKLSTQQRDNFHGALAQWKLMLEDGNSAVSRSVEQSCQKASPDWERSLTALGC